MGADGIPGTADDTFTLKSPGGMNKKAHFPNGTDQPTVDAWFAGRGPPMNQIGIYSVGGAAPAGGTGTTWKVYQINSQPDLDTIKDPGHVEPNGFGPFPITVAIFQEGPTWRIQKVTFIQAGPDGQPNTPDDEYGNAGWVMGTHPTVMPGGLAPIAVDQYFSDPVRSSVYPQVGSYQIPSAPSSGPTTPDSTVGKVYVICLLYTSDAADE